MHLPTTCRVGRREDRQPHIWQQTDADEISTAWRRGSNKFSIRIGSISSDLGMSPVYIVASSRSDVVVELWRAVVRLREGGGYRVCTATTVVAVGLGRWWLTTRDPLLPRDWSIVESALGEHDINCKLDLHNRCMTFSTTRTGEPYIARKARLLLQVLSRNVPASSAINIIKVPHCECEIINTGLSEVDKSCFKELKGQTSCRIFVADGFAGKGFVSDAFVVAIGPLEGLAIVRKAVEYCILYSSYSKAMSTVIATSKKLIDLCL
ncbi:hypothetical protein ACLB2K_061340 [Fragaria x ananassa]